MPNAEWEGRYEEVAGRCGNRIDRPAVTGIRGPVIARLDRAGLSPACAGADRNHRRPGVATGARRQGLKRDEIRLGRDAGPSRAPDASGASASQGPFYFAWGCFRVFVSGHLRCTAEEYLHCVRGTKSLTLRANGCSIRSQPIPLWCPRDRRDLPANRRPPEAKKLL